MNDPAATPREALGPAIAESISALPGVARLVPSFREALTATTKQFFGAEDSQAAIVDIVTHGDRRLIYIDLYTDGSRPAGDIVDAVHDQVLTLLGTEDRDDADINVRVLGIDRAPRVDAAEGESSP